MTLTSFRASLAPVAPLVLGLSILFGYMPHAETEESPLQKLSPVTDAMLAKPAADDWLMQRGNFASWGFSTLDQIVEDPCRSRSRPVCSVTSPHDPSLRVPATA
jgi:hypothetical protein